MRVSFFIDGQNLFHSLKTLSSTLREQDINWEALFLSLLGTNDEIVKAYWIRPKFIKEQIILSRKRLSEIIISEKYPSRKNELLQSAKLPKEVFKVVNSEFQIRLT